MEELDVLVEENVARLLLDDKRIRTFIASALSSKPLPSFQSSKGVGGRGERKPNQLHDTSEILTSANSVLSSVWTHCEDFQKRSQESRLPEEPPATKSGCHKDILKLQTILEDNHRLTRHRASALLSKKDDHPYFKDCLAICDDSGVWGSFATSHCEGEQVCDTKQCQAWGTTAAHAIKGVRAIAKHL
ncbi:MAG: hypothetical protein LQ342_003241 [Letrouitia transgressa]|nr:MAG: hypothetical protein LQ342_003241 [Letrouitia transgressa]